MTPVSPRTARITTRAVGVWLVLIAAEVLHGIARGIFQVPLVGVFRSNQIGVLESGLLPSGMLILMSSPLIAGKLWGAG